MKTQITVFILSLFPFLSLAHAEPGLYWMPKTLGQCEEHPAKIEKRFTKDVQKDPSPLTYTWRAEAYLRARDCEAGSEDIRIALTLSSTAPYVYEARAKLYEMRGESEKALADYTAAVQYSEGNKVWELTGRAWFYYRHKDLKKAADDLTQAIGIKERGDLLHWRADLYEQMGSPQEARKDYDRLIFTNPSFASPLVDRGNFFLRTGQANLALSDFQKASSMEPWRHKDFYYPELYCKTYKALGDAKTIDICKEAADLGSTESLSELKGLGVTYTPRWAPFKFSYFVDSHHAFPSRQYVNGLSLGLLGAIDTRTRGIQVGVLGAQANEIRGIQIGPLSAEAVDLAGIQIGFMANTMIGESEQDSRIRGIQIGGLVITSTVTGVQIGGLSLAHSGSAMQIGGLTCMEIGRVFQVGGINFSGRAKAVQIGIWNDSDHDIVMREYDNYPPSGAQVGLFNIAEGHYTGLQIGFYNSADSLSGRNPFFS